MVEPNNSSKLTIPNPYLTLQMNTYIEHKNLIPYLLELGWMIAKDTWTDCPQKVYDKLAKLSVDDLELVCMEYHSDITSDLVTNLT
jgi:hypothetical protein